MSLLTHVVHLAGSNEKVLVCSITPILARVFTSWVPTQVFNRSVEKYRAYTGYTPQNKHGTWKSVPGKEDPYWKPSFSGSMLNLGGVLEKQKRSNQ